MIDDIDGTPAPQFLSKIEGYAFSKIGKSKWLPTSKWYAQATVGFAGIAASYLATGAFDGVEKGMLGTLISGLAAAYWASRD